MNSLSSPKSLPQSGGGQEGTHTTEIPLIELPLPPLPISQRADPVRQAATVLSNLVEHQVLPPKLDRLEIPEVRWSECQFEQDGSKEDDYHVHRVQLKVEKAINRSALIRLSFECRVSTVSGKGSLRSFSSR